jgi:Transcription factor zinc-finger
MSLLGEKCARCGERRTRREYEGLPTCEACEELIEAKIRAAKEQSRRCPLDGAEMAKEIVLSLVIDRCPTCRGVWLDGGELEQMRGSIEAGLAQDLIRGMAFAPF